MRHAPGRAAGHWPCAGRPDRREPRVSATAGGVRCLSAIDGDIDRAPAGSGPDASPRPRGGSAAAAARRRHSGKGYGRRMVKGVAGAGAITGPRDRNGIFEPLRMARRGPGSRASMRTPFRPMHWQDGPEDPGASEESLRRFPRAAFDAIRAAREQLNGVRLGASSGHGSIIYFFMISASRSIPKVRRRTVTVPTAGGAAPIRRTPRIEKRVN